MPFKEVLQIIPTLSSADLSKMEKSLSSRFVKAAKSFGEGLKKAISVGAIASLLEKFLNPLSEIQASIDKTLEKGSSLSAQSKQFGSSSGELAKLHAFGAASGVDAAGLNVLVEKFQSAVTAATNNPGEHSAVRQFVGQTDAVQGFFDFIQNLKKLGPVQQLQVQEEVFGAKQVLKMSEFLNANFEELNNKFKDIKVDQLTRAVDDISKVADKDQANKAHAALADLINKDNAISQSDVAGIRNRADIAGLNRENDRISRISDIANASLKMDKISENMEKLVSDVVTRLPIIMDLLTDAIKALSLITNATSHLGPIGDKIGQGIHWLKTHNLLGRKIQGK